MRNPKMAILSSALLFSGLVASAQTYGPSRGDAYYRGERYGPRQSGSLIGRVLSDINTASSRSWVDHHERKHFYEATRKLQEFQERWARGHFDNGKLDSAIGNLQHLAQADQVRGREREILYRDLEELRQFRATRGGNAYWR